MERVPLITMRISSSEETNCCSCEHCSCKSRISGRDGLGAGEVSIGGYLAEGLLVVADPPFGFKLNPSLSRIGLMAGFFLLYSTASLTRLTKRVRLFWAIAAPLCRFRSCMARFIQAQQKPTEHSELATR